MMQPSDYLGGRSSICFAGVPLRHEEKFSAAVPKVVNSNGQLLPENNAESPTLRDSTAMEKKLMELSVERDRVSCFSFTFFPKDLYFSSWKTSRLNLHKDAHEKELRLSRNETRMRSLEVLASKSTESN